MTSKNISINIAKIPEAISSLDNKLEKLDDIMNEIFKRAIIENKNGEIPVCQMIVTQFNPSPKELRMLSKAFDKLASLVADRETLQTRKNAVSGWETHSSWLYSEIGDMGKDLDVELTSIFSVLDDHNEQTE
ncbi:MAG: hypothetical protein ACJA1A_003592 [Saprospiraceae bacterium]|jgi:hypothetical protein